MYPNSSQSRNSRHVGFQGPRDARDKELRDYNATGVKRKHSDSECEPSKRQRLRAGEENSSEITRYVSGQRQQQFFPPPSYKDKSPEYDQSCRAHFSLAQSEGRKPSLDNMRAISTYVRQLKDRGDSSSQKLASFIDLFAELNSLLESDAFKEHIKNWCKDVRSIGDISFVLYHMGSLANVRGFPSPNSSSLKLSSCFINIILSELRSHSKLTAKAIANALWGVGKMAEQGLLQGEIFSDVVNGLLNALMVKDCNPQAISNTLWGAGKMAEQGLLQGEIFSDIANGLLNVLNGKGEEAKPQEISNALWGVGKMAEKGLLQQEISFDAVYGLLKVLAVKGGIPQNISNALWGVGKMAEQGLLQQEISSDVVDGLLKVLAVKGGIPQNIINALYGVGKIAEKGLLQQGISSDVVDGLLNALKDKGEKVKPQAISNALYGVGKMAEQGFLQQGISSDVVDGLLKVLAVKGGSPQNISNALYGVGKIAAQGLLQEKISSDVVNRLLKGLADKDCNPQNISNALWGVGKMTAQGVLQQGISSDVVDELLNALNDKGEKVKPQEISNALWGAGKMAEQGVLQEKDFSNVVNGLLKSLADKDCNPQEISNALYGVGKMAEQGLLQEKDFSNVVNGLLKALKDKDCNPQDISNALYGVGKMAEQGVLGASISSEQVDNLLKKLGNPGDIDEEGKVARQILFGLRALEYTQLSPEMLTKLVKRGVISSEVNPLEALRAMRFLAMFSSEQLSHTEIQTLFLDLLDGMNRLPKGVTSALIERFPVTYQKYLAESSRLLKEKNLFLHNAVRKCFWNERISEPTLVTNVPEEDAAPLEIVSEIERPERSEPPFSLRLHIRLRRNTGPLSAQHRMEIAQPTSPIMPLNIERDRHIVQPISSAGRLSAERGAPAAPAAPLSSRLYFTAPIPQAFGDGYATQQLMFQHIVNGNIGELARILRYDLSRLKEERNEPGNVGNTPLEGGNGNVRAQAGNIAVAESSPAKAFFERIPARELTWLIQRPGISKSLRALLDSCRKYTVYDLARTTKFRWLYHMPLNELQGFVEWLKHPMMLHRDSRALLNTIFAISLRADFITRTGELYAIQKGLLTAGIEYHQKCKHTRVLSLLEQKAQELADNHLIILDMPEEVSHSEEDIEWNADRSSPAQASIAVNSHSLLSVAPRNQASSASSSSSRDARSRTSPSSSRDAGGRASLFFSGPSANNSSSSPSFRSAFSSSSSSSQNLPRLWGRG